MVFLGLILGAVGAGFVGHAIKKAHKKSVEDKRRRNTACLFVDGFSEYEFEQMVKRAGKNIRRLTGVIVKGPIVFGLVQSQSGISEWGFKLDFNDYGHITGKYWCTSDNYDSKIPGRLGEMVKKEIKNYSNENKEGPAQPKKENRYCTYCGQELVSSEANFCVFCGTPVKKL